MSDKQIVFLSDYEHVLKRPTMYIGSVEKSEEKIPVYEDGKIILKDKLISVGFYKLLNEIIDNAFDEAKRCKGKMSKIKVKVFSANNRIIVEDDGEGFYKGYEKNSKTNLYNVETAMSMLKAGSNFKNENTEETLIGTNGVGASIVNMLSECFSVVTGDGIKQYKQTWCNFESQGIWIKRSKVKGTSVDYIPKSDLFEDSKWDLEILYTSFIFRNYLMSLDNNLKNIKFSFEFDNVKYDLNKNFIFEEDSVLVDSPLGRIVLTKAFPQSTNLSFINGQMCSGIHQKIVQDYINDFMKDGEKAHEFYDTFISLNFEPKYVIFGDQNKTRFATKRATIEPLIEKQFKSKLKKSFVNSNLYNYINEEIEKRKLGNASKKINTLSKKKTIIVSNKYFPATKRKEMIFLTEGDSAKSSLLQRRDPQTMGVYALRGVVMNVKELKDLTNNKEISELIQILGLELNGRGDVKYEKIIIATDPDVDGAKISSLIIKFFYTWFPNVIRQGRLYQIITPLVTAVNGGKVHRFYSLEEFEKSELKFSNIRYLKGLGSLSVSDWEYEWKNLHLIKFLIDDQTDNIIKLAFDGEAKNRKTWLTT